MTVALVTHLDCLDHDMGRGHPECPARLRAVLAALETEAFAPLLREQAPLATVGQLTRMHPEPYVRAILAIRPEPGDRLARVRFDLGPSMVRRENVERIAMLTANVSGADLAGTDRVAADRMHADGPIASPDVVCRQRA